MVEEYCRYETYQGGIMSPNRNPLGRSCFWCGHSGPSDAGFGEEQRLHVLACIRLLIGAFISELRKGS